MQINIERRNISRGVKSSAKACPLVLSVQQNLKKGVNCSCDGAFLYIRYKWASNSDVIPLPESLIQWIWDYDHGKRVEPDNWAININPNAIFVRAYKPLLKRR